MTARESTGNAKEIIGLFPELLGVGGIQEAGRLTAAALHEIALCDGWSADFLSLNDPPSRHSFQIAERHVSLRGFGRAKMRFVLSCLSQARSRREKATRIVLAAHPNLAVPARWMQLVSPGLRTIVVTHGIEVWEPLPSLRRSALLHANLVLAPSRYTAQKLVEVQGVPPEKIRRLPWPINPGFLRLTDSPASLPLPPTFPRGRVILTVGRWAATERYKGADELIRCISILRATIPDVQMIAIGGGDDLPRLQKLAADLGVADRTHFLENLSREEIAACYAKADVFALPSTGEGFGLVFLEAMAFAKPVVGVAAGGATDVVEDGINGLLIPPSNVEALAQGLETLLTNPALREQLGRGGAEIVRQKYRFEVFQQELEHILEAAVSTSKSL